MEIIPLSVNQEQCEKILAAEAVALSQYRGPDGLFSKLARIGTVAECEEYVNTPSLLIIPTDLKYLGSEVIFTKDILLPVKKHATETEAPAHDAPG